MQTTLSFTVTVVDENDNTPAFTRPTYVATLPENSPVNAFVIDLEATDRDSGTNSQLVYSIVDGGPNSVFQIDSTSGIVTVQRSGPLDFETTRTHFVQVQVEDMGSPVESSRAAVSSKHDHCCAVMLFPLTVDCKPDWCEWQYTTVCKLPTIGCGGEQSWWKPHHNSPSYRCRSRSKCSSVLHHHRWRYPWYVSMSCLSSRHITGGDMYLLSCLSSQHIIGGDMYLLSCLSS